MEITNEEILDIIDLLEREHDIELTNDELLNIEELKFSAQYLEWPKHLHKLSKLKTVYVNPNVGMYGIKVQRAYIQAFLDAGKSVKWLNSDKGGVFRFAINYGVDDCEQIAKVSNNSYLFNDFADVYAFMDNPETFIKNDFGYEEGTFELFHDVENWINDECGDGEEMFCKIVRVEVDEEEIYWESV